MLATRLVSAALLVVGLLHLVPLVGILSPARLTQLYGVTSLDPNVALLLRHRALLFGLLGAALLAAAFVRAWQPAALALGLVSMLGYVILAWEVVGLHAELRRVLRIDVVGSVVAAVALALRLRAGS